MKILVLSQYWAPENGVPQRRWSWLTQILVDHGHEVTVIAPPPHYLRDTSMKEWWAQGALLGTGKAEQGESGEKIVRSGYYPSGSSLTSRALNQAAVAASMLLIGALKRGALRGYSPDLIIGTVPALPVSATTALLSRRWGVPYIIDLRDAWPELLHESKDWNAATGERSLRERVLSRGPLQIVIGATEKVMDQALAHAHGIITTSSYLGEQLKQKYAQTPDKPIRTVRNVFPPRTQPMREPHLEHAPDSLNVLYAGTIGRAQKLENALRAAHIAKERGYTINLRFIGEGAGWVSLRSTAEELGLGANIQHRVPAEDLAESYQWADTALVHLAKWEPLKSTVPSKTYELMTMGIHISAVVAGETGELVETLQAGEVVEPENPEALAEMWIRLIRNQLASCVSENGANWVVEQRDYVAPRELLSIIEEACGARGTSPDGEDSSDQ